MSMQREVIFPAATAGDHQVTAAGGAKTLATGGGSISRVVLTPATNLATVVIYDNTSATGTPILSLQAAASGASVVVDFRNLKFETGLHVVPGGTGALVYVFSAG